MPDAQMTGTASDFQAFHVALAQRGAPANVSRFVSRAFATTVVVLCWPELGRAGHRRPVQHVRHGAGNGERLGFGTAGSQQALYLDDQFSGLDFYRNTVINATVGCDALGWRAEF